MAHTSIKPDVWGTQFFLVKKWCVGHPSTQFFLVREVVYGPPAAFDLWAPDEFSAWVGSAGFYTSFKPDVWGIHFLLDSGGGVWATRPAILRFQ